MRTGHFCLTISLTLVPSLVAAQTTPLDRQLVEDGRRIFFEETFDGNGRTCGTCHPAEHNFTIDADFIAALPPDDPLFVAEFNPALAELENPTLLREFGLILENVDGFDQPPVFRGVPHNVGMTVSILADVEHLGPTRDAVGWSGDGAPGDGTIRDFLTGAITQHFPRTLARVPGQDFRLPTDAELDAVAAFMLSLGVQGPLRPIERRTFADLDVAAGHRLFQGLDGANRACTACHGNAGALDADGINANFDTGVRLVPTLDPEALAGAVLNPDGGFGGEPVEGVAGFGDGTFNAPSLLEVADTPPFFHNNSAETIEDAVAFYTGPIFASSPSGAFGGPFNLDPAQVDQVAAFLRVLNSMHNGFMSVELSREAQRLRGAEASARIIEVIAETEDAIEVLEGARLGFFRDALAPLRTALSLELRALGTRDDAQRNRLLAEAQDMKFVSSDFLTGRRVASR